MNGQKLKQIFDSQTMRLASIYLSIMMLMSVGFSVVFYYTSDSQFSRPINPNNQYVIVDPSTNTSTPFINEITRALNERFDTTRQELVWRLVWINIVTLICGGIISYILARWSLRPIEEAMDTQSQFVSDASHELRTPLTVLQTTNEIALRKKKISTTEAKDLISHNIDEVKRLRDLSNSLLDLLKNNKETVNLTGLNLVEITRESVSEVATLAEEKNIIINQKIADVNVISNRQLLSRLLVIMLDNAIKYSDPQTEIMISAKSSGKRVIISVKDQGIGISSADLPHIFNRFYRSDKTRSLDSAHGYGLGLSIAEKISRQLGTKIIVKSTIGKGSTFSIELPRDTTD